MKTNWMKLPFLGVVMLASSAQAATIDIVGSTAALGGGEFADYTGLAAGNNVKPWDASVVNDGTVSLSAGRTGLDTTVSTAGFNRDNYATYGAGSEINFTQGNDTATNTTAATAITLNTFLSFQLDSTSFGSASVTWDSISLSLWRNGGAATPNFQLAYDSAGDGFSESDLLGSATNITTSGTGNTFTVSSPITSSAGTTREVRLYYWGATNGAGNTHLYDVTAAYTVVPEPSTLGMLAFCSFGLLSHRRRR